MGELPDGQVDPDQARPRVVDRLFRRRSELILQHNHEGWVIDLAAFTGV